MELVKLVYSKNTSLSEPIVGQSFQDEWLKLHVNAGFTNFNGENYDPKVAGKLHMEHTSKEYGALQSVCSLENLKCEGVDVSVVTKKFLRDTAIPSIQKELNLKEELATLSIQKKEIIKRSLDSQRRATLLSQWRYVHNSDQSALLPVVSKTPSTGRSLKQETVFIVQVYRPSSFENPCGPKKFNNFPKRLCHVIAVLGEQKLTNLRDKIICCSDYVVLGEFSEQPAEAITAPRAKNVIKSAFFYIGDTFYNDLRSEDCVDYSKDLIKYAESHSKTSEQLHSKSMEEMLFKNLKFQLGYPYLYVHQGNCEHVIVISDIRLLNPKENQHTYDYPMVCRLMARKRIICMICETFTAKWITHGNKRLSMDPYFFCDICFHRFNYTAEGKKIGEFKAHRYVDMSSIA